MRKHAGTARSSKGTIPGKVYSPVSQSAFEAMRLLPLSVQLEFLRRYYGISQTELSARLGMKQGYLSRLEKEGTDHLLSQYERIAEALQARICLFPKVAK